MLEWLRFESCCNGLNVFCMLEGRAFGGPEEGVLRLNCMPPNSHVEDVIYLDRGSK